MCIWWVCRCGCVGGPWVNCGLVGSECVGVGA